MTRGATWERCENPPSCGPFNNFCSAHIAGKEGFLRPNILFVTITTCSFFLWLIFFLFTSLDLTKSISCSKFIFNFRKGLIRRTISSSLLGKKKTKRRSKTTLYYTFWTFKAAKVRAVITATKSFLLLFVFTLRKKGKNGKETFHLQQKIILFCKSYLQTRSFNLVSYH